MDLQNLNDASSNGLIGSAKRRVEQTFLASATITEGEFLCWDFSKTEDADSALYVKGGSTTDIQIMGVALHDADENERVRVCLAGVCEALVADGVAAKDALVISAVRGTADTISTETTPVLAYAKDANSSGSAALRTVFVIRQF